jgi:hypothetical protein
MLGVCCGLGDAGAVWFGSLIYPLLRNGAPLLPLKEREKTLMGVAGDGQCVRGWCASHFSLAPERV